jgi:hypothetical protein
VNGIKEVAKVECVMKYVPGQGLGEETAPLQSIKEAWVRDLVTYDKWRRRAVMVAAAMAAMAEGAVITVAQAAAVKRDSAELHRAMCIVIRTILVCPYRKEAARR